MSRHSSAQLLAAESVVFTRGSSGVYFEALLKKMGLYEQVEGKITRYDDGASAIEHVLNGKRKGSGAVGRSRPEAAERRR